MEAVLSNPAYHDVLSIVKGCRNGAVYGAKIRFPHALVMTYLFKEGTHRQKWRAILQATFRHSRNLAMFVTIYKTLMVTQRRFHGKERSHDAFLAGLVGGYIVFGSNNPINQQIVLYLFSRILVGGAKVAVARKWIPQPNFEVFPIFAAVVWASVMWLFRHERQSLQVSLQASMQYLYNDSEVWSSLRNWIWHNK